MKKIFLISIIALGLSGCNKKEAIDLKFDVAPVKTSYNVNDTVTFKISGNPDQITFYSGEVGRKYIYKDRLNAESNTITLEFASNKRYGTLATQPNSMKLLATQNFSGTYTAANINESDWVDISSAFTFSGLVGNDNYISSGVVNLLSLGSLGLNIDNSKPVYFAFKYQGLTGSTQPRWWFNKFDIKTVVADGQVLTVADIGTAGWKSVKLGSTPVDWVIESTRIRYAGGNAAVANNDAWIITGPLNLTSVQPDTGIALKNMSTRMDEYSYVFTQPGTYNVTFIASNENVYGGDKVVKELTITVNP